MLILILFFSIRFKENSQTSGIYSSIFSSNSSSLYMTAMNQLPPDLVEDQYIESASKTPTVLDKNGHLLKYNVECTRGNVLYECKYGPCSNLEQHVS